MNLHFWPFHSPNPVSVYKIWLENDGKPIPSEYLQFLNRRKPRNGRVILWTSQPETRDLLAKHKERFPGIFELFWAPHTSPVMRSDILRLLLIFDRGGIYSDHDIEWGRKWLSFDQDFIAWTESVQGDEAVRKNMQTTREHRGEVPEFNVRIANYVFWSQKPYSPILGRCLNRVQERMRKNAGARLSQYGVLYTTGPDAMTDTVIEGLPNLAVLQPYEKCEYYNVEWRDQDGERVLLFGRQPGKAYARHEIHGHWRAAHL